MDSLSYVNSEAAFGILREGRAGKLGDREKYTNPKDVQPGMWRWSGRTIANPQDAQNPWVEIQPIDGMIVKHAGAFAITLAGRSVFVAKNSARLDYANAHTRLSSELTCAEGGRVFSNTVYVNVSLVRVGQGEEKKKILEVLKPFVASGEAFIALDYGDYIHGVFVDTRAQAKVAKAIDGLAMADPSTLPNRAEPLSFSKLLVPVEALGTHVCRPALPTSFTDETRAFLEQAIGRAEARRPTRMELSRHLRSTLTDKWEILCDPFVSEHLIFDVARDASRKKKVTWLDLIYCGWKVPKASLEDVGFWARPDLSYSTQPVGGLVPFNLEYWVARRVHVALEEYALTQKGALTAVIEKFDFGSRVFQKTADPREVQLVELLKKQHILKITPEKVSLDKKKLKAWIKRNFTRLVYNRNEVRLLVSAMESDSSSQ